MSTPKNVPTLEILRLGKYSDSSSSSSSIDSLASSDSSLRIERPINRRILANISPDREDVLMSSRSIEELRHMLRIRSTHGTNNNWLYRTQVRIHRKSASSSQSHDTRRDAIVFNLPRPSFNAGHIPIVPHGLPQSSEVPKNPAITRGDTLGGVNAWGPLMLSTPEQMISPRPLAATHILQIYSSVSVPNDSVIPMLEQPINDLLFLLSTPNLANAYVLPPRVVGGDLPRVAMRVQHLRTFPPLVVYFHTRNQAELMRVIIPEWIRDIVHPALVLGMLNPTGAATPRQQQQQSTQPPSSFMLPHVIRKKKSKIFHRRGSAYDTSSPIPTPTPTPPPPPQVMSVASTLPTLDSVARDLAEMDARMAKDEGLDSACIALDGLSRNIEDVGFAEKALWLEIDTLRHVLVCALNRRARMNTTEGQ